MKHKTEVIIDFKPKFSEITLLKNNINRLIEDSSINKVHETIRNNIDSLFYRNSSKTFANSAINQVFESIGNTINSPLKENLNGRLALSAVSQVNEAFENTFNSPLKKTLNDSIALSAVRQFNETIRINTNSIFKENLTKSLNQSMDAMTNSLSGLNLQEIFFPIQKQIDEVNIHISQILTYSYKFNFPIEQNQFDLFNIADLKKTMELIKSRIETNDNLFLDDLIDEIVIEGENQSNLINNKYSIIELSNLEKNEYFNYINKFNYQEKDNEFNLKLYKEINSNVILSEESKNNLLENIKIIFRLEYIKKVLKYILILYSLTSDTISIHDHFNKENAKIEVVTKIDTLNEFTHYVSVTSANIYESPNKNSQRICKIKQNIKLKIKDSLNNWKLVEYEDIFEGNIIKKFGYISNKKIRKIKNKI